MTLDWFDKHDAFGDGDEPDGVEIRRTGEGSAVVVPKAAQRLQGETLESFARLQGIGLAYQDLDEDRDQAIAEARAAGLSWRLIGWCFGVGADTVRERFGHLS